MKRVWLLLVVLIWGWLSASNLEVLGKIDTSLVVIKNGEIVGMYATGLPPKGWDTRARNNLKSTTTRSSVILDVPAYSWSYGCVPTAAAMLSAYYDRRGYDNLYTGPTNDGVMPMDNSVWGSYTHQIWADSIYVGVSPNGSWIDSTYVVYEEVRDQCPLSASKMGVDGLESKGHVDDYWYKLDAGGLTDPWLVNGWVEHEPDCIADYMGSNQNLWRMVDQGTWIGFSSNNMNGGPSFDYKAGESPILINQTLYRGTKDAMRGLRQFWENKGYSIYLNYNQTIAKMKVDGPSFVYDSSYNRGFTFEEYKSEIDAGRPVFIAVVGHVMLGVGYEPGVYYQDNPDWPKIYIHNTWDYATRSMYWGRTYSGMQHMGAMVFHPHPLDVNIGDTQVTFNLSDSWDDGWQNLNGAFGNGKNYLDFMGFKMAPIAGKSPLSYTFLLRPDTTYTYTYYENAINGNDNSWSVVNSAGNILSRGSGSGFPGREQEYDFYLDVINSYGDPLPPQNLQITKVDTTLILSWSPVLLDIEGNNISSLPIQYIVLRGDSPDFEIAYADRDTVSTTSYTYVPASGETLNFFRVIAFYDGSFQMQDYAPLPPNNIAIARSDTLMAISWSPVLLDVEGNNISTKNVKYKLFVCDNPKFEVIETEVIEVDATSYNYAILENKLKYFRVSAYID